MTNEELCERVPGSDPKWIRDKLGIVARRIAADDEQASDLAAFASDRALTSANVAPDEVDGIICAVGTGDVLSPATAGYIQQKLGITNRCFALDVKMACAGTISGIGMARAFIESGQARHIVVVGTQVITRTSLDWDDRRTAPIFGDGAGACVVSPSTDEGRGILQSRMHTDGSLADIVGQFAGGTREPLTVDVVAKKRHTVKMDGRAVWDCAMREMPGVVREVLDAEGVDVCDIDFVVSHQANKRLLHSVLETLGIPTSKTYTNVENYGNTVAASALVCLDEASRTDLIRRGDLIVVLAIGAGMSWGAHLMRW